MPAVVVGTPQRSEQMWQALKIHITRERQRKKEEQEADAEEERQRKERERQQKQDVMTLGETREQIATVESELAGLKNEKHQLFVQLKKVLHEDDNRRRLIKETNNACPEPMQPMQPIQPSGGYVDPNPVVHTRLYLPLPTRSPVYKVASGPLSSGALLQSGPLKRTHSPSPPPLDVPYGYVYKPPLSMPSYITKGEDPTRRSGDARVVLWNKQHDQFPSQSSYYSQATTYSDYMTSQPMPRVSEAGKPVYMASTRSPMTTMQSEDKYYTSSGHFSVHGNAIPIQQPMQGAKTGSITAGYPVRTSQSIPDPYPPAPSRTYPSLTVTSNVNRMLYTQPGRCYLPRET